MSELADLRSQEMFREAITRQFGLRFDDSRLSALGELLQRRASARDMPIAMYLAQLPGDATEAGPLAEALTVGETYFFRNGEQFLAFREIVLPAAMKAKTVSGQLSVLSAGCSTGEEPYTIAMLTRTLAAPPWRVSIRAVDINPASLKRAGEGRYGPWSLRETPPAMLAQWFSPQGRDMQVAQELRSAVTFERANLADPDAEFWRAGPYDAIFCRNVIMYLTPQVQHAVIARIARSLAPGGYLFLGHAETLRGLSQEFHLVHTHGTFYYQRRVAGEAAAYPAESTGYLPLPPATLQATDTSWYTAIGEASRRIEVLTAGPMPVTVPEQSPRWSLETALDLLQRERFSEALALIERMPPEAAEDPDVLLLQALLLVQDGKFTAAAQVCSVLIMQDEMSAGANHVLGLCFEGAGDARKAVHHYGIASHLDPRFAMPLLRRGLIARRAGTIEAAREDLEQALELLKLEDTSRILLFGGGFTRGALMTLCESELRASEAAA